jgi:uncharacterized phage protein gp47/JayE
MGLAGGELMPFPRPTLSALRARIAAFINSAIPAGAALLRYSNMGIIGDVVAGSESELYGYLDWIALQSVPFTATGEYLEAWAALKGVTRKQATPAIGSALFSGTNGSVLPAGTVLQRADGVTYTVNVNQTVSGSTVTVAITATVPGASGDAPNATPLTLASGVSGITSTGAASGPLTGGADVETDAALRSRMLVIYAAPPQGGDADDYVEWALGVPGVTRAWTKALTSGAGTVGVFFMMDVSEAAFNGFPQGTNGVAAAETRDTAATGDQLAVANAIYLLQPVTALVYAIAPVANPIALTINGIAGASTAVKNAISAAITAALLVGASPGGTTNLSAIEAAIAGVAGTAGFVITLVTCPHGTVVPGATGNVTASAGYLNTLGTITYT